jgi:hypothetical protein
VDDRGEVPGPCISALIVSAKFGWVMRNLDQAVALLANAHS